MATDDMPPPAALHCATRPRATANAVAFATMALTMAWIVTVASHAPEPLAFLRQASSIFVTMHGALHIITLGRLKRLCGSGTAGAEEALSAYRDPRRVNQFDIAMAWAGFAALASVVIRLFIADAPADG